MSRELTDHKTNPLNDLLTVTVEDAPTFGNAHHSYRVGFPDRPEVWIQFQKGPIAEHGINGITHEVLLAILIDRLECFQEGEFNCEENGQALVCLTNALEALKSRTQKRVERGVEGTNQV